MGSFSSHTILGKPTGLHACVGSLEHVLLLHPGFCTSLSFAVLLIYTGIRLLIASAPAGVNAGRAFSAGRSPGGGPSQNPLKSRGSNFPAGALLAGCCCLGLVWPKATKEKGRPKTTTAIKLIKRLRMLKLLWVYWSIGPPNDRSSLPLIS